MSGGIISKRSRERLKNLKKTQKSVDKANWLCYYVTTAAEISELSTLKIEQCKKAYAK